MKVRRPVFDFSKTPVHWARHREFAQSINASSTWLPYMEPFLNRVMARAAKELDPSAPGTTQLKEDIKTFIRQESMHYTNHIAFNQVLTREGYDIAEFERYFEAEFERLFTTKSLAFLCAYCAGFETFGPAGARMWLGEIEDVLDGADPEIVRLWKWHLMEEFEHRTVCHDVFAAISGNYFLRVYGMIYQLAHVAKLTSRVLAALNERDWANLSTEERKAAKKRSRQGSMITAKSLLAQVLRAMVPFYTPREARIPKQYQAIFNEYDVYAL